MLLQPCLKVWPSSSTPGSKLTPSEQALSGALCGQVLDLQAQTLLQRRYITDDPHAPVARYTASWGSIAALPEGRVAVGCGEGLDEGEASVTVFEMSMTGAELARTGDLGPAEQASRIVLHAHARHPERCATICVYSGWPGRIQALGSETYPLYNFICFEPARLLAQRVLQGASQDRAAPAGLLNKAQQSTIRARHLSLSTAGNGSWVYKLQDYMAQISCCAGMQGKVHHMAAHSVCCQKHAAAALAWHV